MILTAFPLEAHAVQNQEGFQRATVWLPLGAQILHLGAALPTNVICVFALIKPQAVVNGEPVPYKKSDLRQIEFIVAAPGQDIPAGYVFRGPVRTKHSESGVEGLIFLFEKQTSAILVAGN